MMNDANTARFARARIYDKLVSVAQRCIEFSYSEERPVFPVFVKQLVLEGPRAFQEHPEAQKNTANTIRMFNESARLRVG